MQMDKQALKNRIKKKIRSRTGDSIAEVLIALLISSLALVMLASMITASANMITKSRDTLEDYYAETGGLSSPGETGQTMTVDVTVGSYSTDSPPSYTVVYYRCDNPGFEKVIAFKKS